LLLGILATLAQTGEVPAEVEVPLALPAAAKPAEQPSESTRKPLLPEPTYSNSPTPFGDFPGPSFGPSTPDRMPLMKILQGTWPGDLLDSQRTQITGWIDMSYNASSTHHDNRPSGFDFRANEFLVQENVIRVDRSVDTGSKSFDYGYRMDWLVPGSDYRYTIQRGLFFGQLARNQLYGIDPVEFYVDLWFPELGQGTDVRLGRFLCTGGVEAVLSLTNILSTHSYIMIPTPFTHTGGYATTKLSDQWYVQYGMVLGNDVFFDPTDQPTLVGGVKWVSLSKTDSLFFSCYVNGGNYFSTRQKDNIQYFDLVYTHVFTPRFQTITEMLFSYQANVPNLNTITAYGIDTHFQYDFTPRLYGAIRPEVWVDPQGQRTGFRGVYTTLTAGLTFRPTKWLYLRPELRFDHNYGPAGPYEGRHSLFTALQDVVVRW
jgi:hypothetical protein